MGKSILEETALLFEKTLPFVTMARKYDTKTDKERVRKTTKPRTVTCFETSYYVSGGGELFINGENRKIEPNYVRFNKPGDVVYSSCDYSCFTFTFNLSNQSETVFDKILSGIKPYFKAEGNVLSLYNEVINGFLSGKESSIISQSGLVLQILAKLYETNQNNYNIPESVLKCMKYLEENFQNKITLENLGEVAGYSSLHVLRLFKENLNKTPHDYLTEIRLNYAKTLITEDPYISIGEIAYKCGFNSESHFKTLFKEYYKITVGKFKSRSHTAKN